MAGRLNELQREDGYFHPSRFLLIPLSPTPRSEHRFRSVFGPDSPPKATDGVLGAGQERLDRFDREHRGSSRQELSRSNAALTFASSSASGADPSRSKASAALLRAAAACASRYGPPFSRSNLLYTSA